MAVAVDELGPYQLVLPHKDTPADARRLVLDTNVAIDIERFYFGKAPPRILEGLRALNDALPPRWSTPQIEVVYGFAVKEASWPRGRGFDALAYRRMLHSVSRWSSWDKRAAAAALSGRYPPHRRDKRALDAIPSGRDAPDEHPLLYVLASYAPLLYLCHLDRTRGTWRPKGGDWALSRYLHWLRTDFGVVGAYETQLGLDMLLGDDERRNGVRRVLKLSGTEAPDVLADHCWSTAWDISFLRITEGATFGLFPLPEGALARVSTGLLTRDRDPGFMRAQAEIDSYRHNADGSGVDVYVGFDLSKHPAAREFDLGQLLDGHMQDPQRRIRTPETLVASAIEATNEAESMMHVEKSALMGSRWS